MYKIHNNVPLSSIDGIIYCASKEGRLPYSLICDQYDVVIYEGYDMVGKTTLLNKAMDSTSRCISYRPDYDIVEIPGVLDRATRFVPGLCVLDYYSQTFDPYKTLNIDRGVGSWIVYGTKYNGQHINAEPLKSAVQRFNTLCHKLNILIVYKYHKCKEDAQLIHQKSMSSRQELDAYDIDDFEQYWNSYLEFHEEYKKAFRYLNCHILAVDSMDTVYKYACEL